MAVSGQLAEGSAASASYPDPAAVAEAHRAIRADSAIQFDLAAPPVPDPPPDWLLAIMRWLASLGTFWQIFFWVVIALAAVLLVIALVPPLRRWLIDRFRRRPAAEEAVAEPDAWAPEAARAHALLDEADRLAEAGDYDAAVHIILMRSIEDIEAWRGESLRPSLTARDIVEVPDLPQAARGVFGRLVAAVERSLFAGRRLAAADWQRARDDYSTFALGRR